MGQLHASPVPPPVEERGAVRQDVRRAALAYVEHLLAGGVATWPEFLAGPGSEAEPSGAGLGEGSPAEPPGATQAELLRRLNGRAGVAAAGHRELGERVLRRAGPGRGVVDLQLTDPPQRVPVAELLRVGAGVLADLVAELPPVDAPVDARRVRPASPVRRRRAPTYRLEGPPLTVAALRRRLVAAGLPPRGGRRWRLRRRRPDVVLVVALPLRRALFEVWSRRTQRGGTKSWHGLLAEWDTTRRLPPGAAYDRLAAGWASRIGAGRVHVVTGEALHGQVAAVLGGPVLEGPAAGGPAPGAALLTPVLVEVVRRASEVLTFRVPPQDKQHRLDRLVGILGAGMPEAEGGRTPPGAPRGAPPTPPAHRRWLTSTGRRTAGRLRSGGYVVHGSLSSLGRTGRHARPPRGWERAVLAAMLGSVLQVDAARTAAGVGRGTAR